ncbi:MAG: hypothetical protein MPK75_12025 [Alphaproteobacteria bacterium]|nr:hypothetical protein [Alphaproteobacteria bacterium]
MQAMVVGVQHELPLKVYVHAGEATGPLKFLDSVISALQLVMLEVPSKTPRLRDGRADVWRRMYGSEPLPKREPNTAIKYSGSAGRDLNLTDEDVDEIFEQLNNE